MSALRLVLKIIAVLAVLLGVIWIGQGTGLFPYPASSFMINQSPWILNGALLALAGLAGLYVLRRRG
jgi:MYXO-CTERM domain-containing protein